MRLTVIFILLSLPLDLFPQRECNDNYLKKTRKEIRKAHSSIKGQLIYEYAQCYKNQNDSLYKPLIQESLNYFKSNPAHFPSKDMAKILFICGEISLELNDMKSADSFYQKGFTALRRNSEIRPIDFYYFGVIQYRSGEYENAIQAFEAYKFLFPNDESIDNYLEDARNKQHGR